MDGGRWADRHAARNTGRDVADRAGEIQDTCQVGTTNREPFLMYGRSGASLDRP